MKRLWVAITRAAAIAAGIAMLAAGAAHVAGLRLNTSRSLALGLYRTSDEPARKGVYVLFCPPPTAVFAEARHRRYITHGFCPGGYGYMMKRVLGAAGDAVHVDADGVRINGQVLPYSRPMEADNFGRPLPRFASDYTLRSGELLLMTDVSSTSFDGRYFGPVASAQIKTVVRPLITW